MYHKAILQTTAYFIDL